MCEEIEINSLEEMEAFIQSATIEELYVLREDLLNSTDLSDEDEE